VKRSDEKHFNDKPSEAKGHRIDFSNHVWGQDRMEKVFSDRMFRKASAENYVWFEVLTTTVMKSFIFCDITSRSPLKVNRRFGGTCRLNLQVQR
jgi:hypothetical protein